jgi:hypothetical protein
VKDKWSSDASGLTIELGKQNKFSKLRFKNFFENTLSKNYYYKQIIHYPDEKMKQQQLKVIQP